MGKGLMGSVRTDCKPRANNQLFGGETGVRRGVVDEGNPFMIATGIGTILLIFPVDF
jgi:hypothetical protein